MLLVELVLAAVILSLATGGSLRLLAREQLKGEWVLLILLPAQLIWPDAARALGVKCGASVAVWLAMMMALAAVLILNSRRRWMLALAALGISLNVLVIALNTAMPVSIMAASEIGGTRADARRLLKQDCLHEEIDGRTVLPQLADIVPIPGPPWHRSVISIGDLLLALGLAGWAFAASRSIKGVQKCCQ
jgi:hypothetical protein